MSETTLTKAELEDLRENANMLYDLYNKIGRGNVSEIVWLDAYIKNKLLELIKEKCDG